jgi:DNA replication protein DnaC
MGKSAFEGTPGMVLIGGVGVGKTHLALAIANVALDAEIVVLFATVPDLLDHLRATFDPSANGPVYDELFERMRNAELLILDDLGVQRGSSWADEKLFQLLNHRYTRRLPTVITMNEKAWTYLDDRLQSRLSDQSFVEIVGFKGAQDYRRRNQGRNAGFEERGSSEDDQT